VANSRFAPFALAALDRISQTDNDDSSLTGLDLPIYGSNLGTLRPLYWTTVYDFYAKIRFISSQCLFAKTLFFVLNQPEREASEVNRKLKLCILHRSSTSSAR
jgi:hypothetical protein